MALIGNNKIIFGITGRLASGKTFTRKMFAKIAKSKKINITAFDLDEIRRYILYKSTEIKHHKIRQKLLKTLNLVANDQRCFIDNEALCNKFFFDLKAAQKFKTIINPEIKKILISKIKSTDGIIILEWAMLFEDGFLPLVNNNTLFVHCNKNEQKTRLKTSDLPYIQLRQRIKIQGTNTQKISNLREHYLKIKRGHLWTLNTSNKPNKNQYKKLFGQIIFSLTHA